MRQLSNGVAMSEARRFKTLVLGRSVGSGASAVALPQATAQNQIIIADATPAWTLLAAPTAEGQVPITGADPYTPAWGTTFPTVIQFDAGLTFGGATGVNVVTVPDGAAQAMHIVDSGGTEFLRIRTDGSPVVVFNEGGADVDFRVEAVGEYAALKVDGATGWVGILDNSPSAPLDVNGAIRGGYDTDVRCNFGRAAVGWCGVNDQAAFGHVDAMSTTGFALLQTTGGTTVLNAASGQILHLNVGDVHRINIATGAVVFNETGTDVDHRWEASGQPNALFIQGSDGKRGMGTGDPAGWLHILSSTVTNVHRPGYSTTPTLILDDGSMAAVTLQLAARDYSTRMCHIVMTGAPTSGDNKHWIISHLGLDASNRFSVGYLTSSATDFLTWGDVDEYLTISTAGAVHIVENSATARLSGTFALHIIIPEPIVETVGQIRIPWDCTVTRVDANVVGGTSCTFNIEERGTLGSAGTDVLSSDMVADANGESVTSSFGNSSLAEGNHLAYDVSAVSGAIDEVSITITGTVD